MGGSRKLPGLLTVSAVFYVDLTPKVVSGSENVQYIDVIYGWSQT